MPILAFVKAHSLGVPVEKDAEVEKKITSVAREPVKGTGFLCTSADSAYNCDPRVKKFKETEKAEKEAKKRAKVEAARREAALKKEVCMCVYNLLS